MHLWNWAFCDLTVLLAKSRAFLRSWMAPKLALSSAFMACRTCIEGSTSQTILPITILEQVIVYCPSQALEGRSGHRLSPSAALYQSSQRRAGEDASVVCSLQASLSICGGA